MPDRAMETLKVNPEKEEQEEEWQNTIQMKNKQLSQAKKAGRQQLSTRPYSTAASGKKSKPKKAKEKEANPLPKNTANALPIDSQPLDYRPAPTKTDNSNEACSSPPALALYPLCKKNQEISAEQQQTGQPKRSEKKTVSAAQDVVTFSIKWPEREMFLTKKYPNLRTTISHLCRIVESITTTIFLPEKDYKRLGALAILRDCLALSNCLIRIQKTHPILNSKNKITVLRNLIAHAGYLPSTDSIWDMYCNFTTELEAVDSIYTLLDSLIPLAACYSPALDTVNEKDFFDQRDAICQDIVTLKTIQAVDPSSKLFGPAADMVYLVAHALISKHGWDIPRGTTEWRNIAAHTEFTSCDGDSIYTTVAQLDVLLYTLYKLLPVKNIADQVRPPLLPRSHARSSLFFKPDYRPEDDNTQPEITKQNTRH